MSQKNSKAFINSIAELKDQLDIMTEVNAISINTSINISLWPDERKELSDVVRRFAKRVYSALDSLLDSPINIIEKMTKISSLIDDIENKRTEKHTFIRYYPLVKKYITVTGYYSDPLISSLRQLCDLYLNHFESEFNIQNKQQRLDFIRQYIRKAPIRLFRNINDAYDPVENLIIKQIDNNKSQQYINDLDSLLNLIDKMRSIRIAVFWLSTIPAITLFIVLSTLWGESLC